MNIEDLIDRAIEFEERETRRKNIQEAAGCVLVLLGMAALAWLFLAMTPSQRSAEAEAAAELAKDGAGAPNP